MSVLYSQLVSAHFHFPQVAIKSLIAALNYILIYIKITMEYFKKLIKITRDILIVLFSILSIFSITVHTDVHI